MILLTGASGFVGNAVLNEARLRLIEIRPVYRSFVPSLPSSDYVTVSSLDGSSDWLEALKGVDVVVHVAAVTQNNYANKFALFKDYQRVNVEGTINLARQAVSAGVRRFVFISSIKVNGETTLLGRPFTADDHAAPEDAYGVSKAEAESQLKKLAFETGIELTIIRPPLIYGKGVKGNFSRLLSWVDSGLPLPLGGITHNRRSLVGLDNLVDFILLCAEHPKAANHTFLVSDGDDISTTLLIRKISIVLKRRVFLPSVPLSTILFVSGIIGKREVFQRLLGSLQVDISKTCERLDWKPLISVDVGLRKALE